MKHLLALSLAAFTLIALNGPAAANETQTAAPDKDEYTIIIKDHKFSPETLEVPSGKKIKLLIDNQDATPEEFESYELSREKIIRGNSKGTVFIGPLDPGTYPYFGEFNMDTAKGIIIAK